MTQTVLPPTPHPTPHPTPRPYRAPQVTDLGRWEAVTLAVSLPIGNRWPFDPSAQPGSRSR
ncbi:hypothetical protein [Deinococcus kurensis]|uniref:hypothetical protein n=1 Tax=Deinococcus kurensis TaxID=2662757 RepID=UPI0012D2EF9B|nr:hypothetical protein [Deinococcus kurensis]